MGQVFGRFWTLLGLFMTLLRQSQPRRAAKLPYPLPFSAHAYPVIFLLGVPSYVKWNRCCPTQVHGQAHCNKDAFHHFLRTMPPDGHFAIWSPRLQICDMLS